LFSFCFSEGWKEKKENSVLDFSIIRQSGGDILQNHEKKPVQNRATGFKTAYDKT